MHRAGLGCVILSALSCEASAESVPCRGGEAYLHVQTSSHRLWLCDAGRSENSFGVRLGKGGLGKSREGDGKTPLGTYPLGEPRPSNRYGTFIPIGYPTKEQQAKGYTGSSVGVHGPHRFIKWLGRYVNSWDLSDGCIGLAYDEEMRKIVAFVARTNAKTIVVK